jgi:hypothetical protein
MCIQSGQSLWKAGNKTMNVVCSMAFTFLMDLGVVILTATRIRSMSIINERAFSFRKIYWKFSDFFC